MWRKSVVRETASLHDAMVALDAGAVQICVVLDRDGILQGVITDGDIRRAILNGFALTAPVTDFMTRDPLVAHADDQTEDLIALMRSKGIHQLPMIDGHGKMIDLVVINTLLKAKPQHDNWVVLMAGGLGQRLRPLTDDTPKPMLPVGGKPVLQTIIENCRRQGFHRFYISVNYRAEQIIDHFGDGSRLGVEIRYLRETEKLGTGGALRLIPEVPEAPFFVMNGDVLTKMNFETLLHYHRENDAFATMCVREYDFQVPFGVVDIDGNRIAGIAEKPVHSFFVNAGIYCLDPRFISLLPPQGFVDMPQLFTKAQATGENVVAFPLHEYWIDIGRVDDLYKANDEFRMQFD